MPEGKDKADDAIVEDLELFAFNPRYKALVVVSSDAESVLAKLDAIAAEGWHRCVAVLGPSGLGRWRFQPGGGLEHLKERYTLANIFAEQASLRTESAVAEASSAVEVATVARVARKKAKRRTAAQREATYAKLAEELHAAEADVAGNEIRKRFGAAANAVAVSSIQVSMTNAVRKLPDHERTRDLLDWIGTAAEAARERLGETPSDITIKDGSMTTIGITGHINITPETRMRVAHELTGILAAQEAPLVGLTSLAPGADQAFAWAVAAVGGEIVFVQPCSRIEESIPDSNRSQFRAARALAAELVALPFEEPSEDAYLAAGEYIADNVDLLVAVYDGELVGGKGGTADVVDRRNAAGRPVVVVWPPGSSRG